jgi:hypothetical protein
MDCNDNLCQNSSNEEQNILNSEDVNEDFSDEELSFLSEQLSILNPEDINEDDQNMLISETEDSLEESEAKAEYPNLAYADLMTLVTKHKINNVTGNAIINFFNKHANLEKSPLPKSIQQGRKYMDNMNLPNLKYHKTQIITYNGEDYFLHHRSLKDCIKNILSIPDLSRNFALNFEELKISGERVYSEQNTGTWWKGVEESLPIGAKLLSIILYSDATNVDTLGKSQLHPIYISIGNIYNWRRNKPDAKELLGYLPILKSCDNTERKSNNFKMAVREVFHKSLKILLEPILLLKDNGLDLILNEEHFWFYPRISVVISDWPEAATFCLTYKSSMSNHPCHFCLVARDDLANINLQHIESRTHINMSDYLNRNLEKSVCIENMPNFFWTLP